MFNQVNDIPQSATAVEDNGVWSALAYMNTHSALISQAALRNYRPACALTIAYNIWVNSPSKLNWECFLESLEAYQKAP